MPFLETRALTATYGKVKALVGLDLEVERSELFALLGPSGSGKSTLIHCIAGIHESLRGSILLDGKELTGTPPERRDIGVVFQEGLLFPHMSISRNIEFPLRIRGWDPQERRKRVEEVLDWVRLPGLGHRMPHELSGGQKQRAALARALVFRPGVLLLDEPLGALDMHLRRQMQEEIRQLQRESATTTLYVTHDQAEAAAIADRIGILSEGQIIQAGLTSTLAMRPENKFVASFFGLPNTLKAWVEALGIGQITVLVGRAHVGQMPAPLWFNGTRAPVQILFPRSSARIHSEITKGSDLPVVVEHAYYFDGHWITRCVTEDNQLIEVASNENHELEDGEAVYLDLDLGKTQLFKSECEETDE